MAYTTRVRFVLRRLLMDSTKTMVTNAFAEFPILVLVNFGFFLERPNDCSALPSSGYRAYGNATDQPTAALLRSSSSSHVNSAYLSIAAPRTGERRCLKVALPMRHAPRLPPTQPNPTQTPFVAWGLRAKWVAARGRDPDLLHQTASFGCREFVFGRWGSETSPRSSRHEWSGLGESKS